MSKKKKQHESNRSDQTPATVIAQCLEGRSVGDIEFEIVTEQLLEFAGAARDASQPQLAAAAELLSQLSELASADSQTEDDDCLATQVVDFIRSHLSTVFEADGQDDRVLDAMVEDANQRWGDYLDAFRDFPGDADNLNETWTDDCEAHASDSAAMEDIEEIGDYGSQIDMMLSAIGDMEATSDDVAVEPPSTEMFTDESAAGDTDDTAAVAALLADREMLEAYLDDANGCVTSMERAALELESQPGQPEPVRQFCRELHTLKGASATVGLAGLATFLHELESSLEKSFDGDHSDAQTDQLMNAVDTVQERLQSLSEPTPDASNTSTAGKSATNSIATPNLSSGAGDEASIRIRASRLDRLMDMLAELVVLRNRRESHVTEFNRLNEELTRCSTRLRFSQDAEMGYEEFSVGTATQATTSVAAEISRDIAELGNELRSLQKPISTDNAAISRFVRDFRQELMQLRRMPVSGLFQRLQRAARDAAKVEGKQVQVQLLGADTGLEQELQESLYEPLIHVVRNAVGHGIETPDQRGRSGKGPAGTITLEAKSSSQLLVIEVRDDGNGLDYDAVRKRAQEKGLLPSHATPSEAELAKLIFHPGFSTKEQVSELSGRGVGMDVVATAIEQLRGRIEITSQRGQGTTMRFTIPLRSGIEHVLVFRTAGQLFALPMQTVQATRETDSASKAANTLDLANVLSLRGESNQSSRNVILMREASQLAARTRSAESSQTDKRRGFVVDEIIGPEEVVVRSLPAFMAKHPLFCGVTLSGTGETVLLIESTRLNEFCETYFDGRVESNSPNDTVTDQVGRNVLVVDDSLSARKNLVRKLTAAGYKTTEAGDGLAALECINNQPFDLIFTDLDMPQMGGLELLADLQNGAHREIPVVVVSARSEQEFRDQAREAGAIDFLVKPATDEQLTLVLNQLTVVTT